MDFCSFHTHTGYSLGDGFGTVEQHVKRVHSLGMSALAFSEHGNVNCHVQLEKSCQEYDIKPIFGIESYFSPIKDRRKFHLGLYAMDEEGYRNLSKIVSESYINTYQYPTVNWEILEKYNAGIVCLSGCSDSLISCTLLGGKQFGDKRLSYTEQDYRNTAGIIRRFTDIFTPDRFFLEAQRFPGLDRTCVLNPAFANLSVDTGVSLLATADVHYPFGSENQMQKILHAGRRKSSIVRVESEWEYDILLTYPESDEEIIFDLVETGLSYDDSCLAVKNTKLLAEQCNVTLPKARPLRYAIKEQDWESWV